MTLPKWEDVYGPGAKTTKTNMDWLYADLVNPPIAPVPTIERPLPPPSPGWGGKALDVVLAGADPLLPEVNALTSEEYGYGGRALETGMRALEVPKRILHGLSLPFTMGTQALGAAGETVASKALGLPSRVKSAPWSIQNPLALDTPGWGQVVKENLIQRPAAYIGVRMDQAAPAPLTGEEVAGIRGTEERLRGEVVPRSVQQAEAVAGPLAELAAEWPAFGGVSKGLKAIETVASRAGAVGRLGAKGVKTIEASMRPMMAVSTVEQLQQATQAAKESPLGWKDPAVAGMLGSAITSGVLTAGGPQGVFKIAGKVIGKKGVATPERVAEPAKAPTPAGPVIRSTGLWTGPEVPTPTPDRSETWNPPLPDVWEGPAPASKADAKEANAIRTKVSEQSDAELARVLKVYREKDFPASANILEQEILDRAMREWTPEQPIPRIPPVEASRPVEPEPRPAPPQPVEPPAVAPEMLAPPQRALPEGIPEPVVPEAPPAPQEPRYAYRVRTVGEKGVPGKNHAQASLSEADVRRMGPTRLSTSDQPDRAQEVVRIDLNQLPVGTVKEFKNNWVAFKGGVPEELVEVVGPLTPADRAAASKVDTLPKHQADVVQAVADATLADPSAAESVAKRAGLTIDEARKGAADVKADAMREFSPEAVSLKRSILEELPLAEEAVKAETVEAPKPFPVQAAGEALAARLPKPQEFPAGQKTPVPELPPGLERGEAPDYAARTKVVQDRIQEAKVREAEALARKAEAEAKAAERAVEPVPPVAVKPEIPPAAEAPAEPEAPPVAEVAPTIAPQTLLNSYTKADNRGGMKSRKVLDSFKVYKDSGGHLTSREFVDELRRLSREGKVSLLFHDDPHSLEKTTKVALGYVPGEPLPFYWILEDAAGASPPEAPAAPTRKVRPIPPERTPNDATDAELLQLVPILKGQGPKAKLAGGEHLPEAGVSRSGLPEKLGLGNIPGVKEGTIAKAIQEDKDNPLYLRAREGYEALKAEHQEAKPEPSEVVEPEFVPPEATEFKPEEIEKAPEPKVAPAKTAPTVSFTKKGIDIEFQAKPSAERIAELKRAGYRAAKGGKIWRAKDDTKAQKLANIYAKAAPATRYAVERAGDNTDTGSVIRRIPGDEGTELVLTRGIKGRVHVTLRDVEAGESVTTRIYPSLESAEKAVGKEWKRFAVEKVEGVDPDAIDSAVLDRMDKRLQGMGYDSRGAEDVRSQLKKRGGRFVNPDWRQAYESALENVQPKRREVGMSHVNQEVVRALRSTGDPKKAGYIRPNGSLADMSGGGDARGDDHRLVGGTAGMQELVSSGWIRWMPESDGFDIGKEPTPKQYRQIQSLAERANGKVIVDLADGLGELRDDNLFYSNPERTSYFEYPEGTKATKIVGDIRRFFAGEDITPGKRFAVEEKPDKLGFYSHLERLAAKIPQPMRSEDMQRYLSDPKRSPGVAIREEMKWTGLDDWLKERAGQKVTPQEVLEFVKANRVEVKEVVLGGSRAEARVKEIDRILETRDPGAEKAKALIAERRRLKQYLERRQTKTKFSQYQTPGGENYRELLLTLPAKQLTREEFARSLDDSDSNPEKHGHFTGGHYPEPDVLAHIRFDDRVIDGKKTLFVEEIQSDWAQKGRKEGFALRSEDTAPLDSEYRALVHKNLAARNAGKEPSPTDVARAQELENILIRSDKSKIPSAPFVEDTKAWTELAVKRTLRWAAENGYDRVAWTTGEMQAERYDLSKQLDQLFIQRQADGTFDISGYPKGENRSVDIANGVPREKLSNYIGKELAEKIDPSKPTNHFSGLDLKVGGEGMKGYYDEIIPQVFNKVGRKWGAKVGETEIQTEETVKRDVEADARQAASTDGFDWNMMDEGSRDVYRESAAEAAAEYEATVATTVPVPSIDISSEMRASVTKEGFSRFATEKPAAKAKAPAFTKETVRKAFRAGAVRQDAEQEFTIQLPGGVRGKIKFTKDGIEYDEASYIEEYKAPLDTKTHRLVGVTKPGRTSKEAIIAVMEDAANVDAVLGEEAYHMGYLMALGPKERAILDRDYGSEQNQAKKFLELREEFSKGGTAHPVLKRVYDFIRGIYRQLFPNGRWILEQIESGKVWGKEAAAESGKRFAVEGKAPSLVPPTTDVEAYKKTLTEDIAKGEAEERAARKARDFKAERAGEIRRRIAEDELYRVEQEGIVPSEESIRKAETAVLKPQLEGLGGNKAQFRAFLLGRVRRGEFTNLPEWAYEQLLSRPEWGGKPETKAPGTRYATQPITPGSTPTTPGGPLEIPKEKKLERVERLLADYQNRVRVIEKQAEKQGLTTGPTGELERTLAGVRAKAGYKQSLIKDLYTKPLSEEIIKAKSNETDLGDYLTLLHKPQGDKVIAHRNPGASRTGLTDAEADALWSKLESTYGPRNAQGRINALEPAAQIVRDMRDENLEASVWYGLRNRAQVKALQDEWGPDYAPMWTKEAEDGSEVYANSRTVGFNVRGKESQQAHGQAAIRAENPIAVMTKMYETTIKRGENAIAGQRLAKFARETGAFKIDEPRFRKEIDKDGKTKVVRDALAEERDDFHYKEDGVEHRINIKDVDPILDQALRNANAMEVNAFVAKASGLTRRFTRGVTAYNPIFMFNNLPRDLQESLLNMGVEAPGMGKTVIKGLPGSMKALWKLHRDAKSADPEVQIAREFKEDGGSVSWVQSSKPETIEKELHNMIKHAGPGVKNAAIRSFKTFVDYVESTNEAVENATRLSVYKAMRGAGISREKAGHYARNVSLDFTKHGEAGPLLNSLYAFFNARVQGVKRMAEVVPTKRGAAYVAAMATAGLVLNQWNRAMAGDEDKDGTNDYDEIPEYVKRNKWVFIPPGGKPLMFPLPPGWGMFASVGRHFGDVASGLETPGKAAVSVLGATRDMFNPLGSEGGLVQQLTPTLLDPLVQQATNTRWTGTPISPEQPAFGPRKPPSELYWKNTPKFSKWLSRGMNKLSGGDRVTPGWASVPPELINNWAEHINNYIGGGMTKTALKGLELGATLAKGETPEIRNVPVLSSFVYSESPSVNNQKFRENLSDVEDLWYRYKEYRKAGEIEKAKEIPVAMLRLKRYLDYVQNRISKLRKASHIPDAEEQIRKLQAEANRAVARARKSEAVNA